MADEYHVFGIDWTPNALIWRVDGVEVWRVLDYVPQVPMYLLLNLAVGGDWPGSPDNSTVFPARYSVDYCRVWERV